MTDEQVGMLLADLKQLNRGFAVVARHIIEQEAEICALRSMLEDKAAGSAQELREQRESVLKMLKKVFSSDPKRRQRACRRRSSDGSIAVS